MPRLRRRDSQRARFLENRTAGQHAFWSTCNHRARGRASPPLGRTLSRGASGTRADLLNLGTMNNYVCHVINIRLQPGADPAAMREPFRRLSSQKKIVETVRGLSAQLHRAKAPVLMRTDLRSIWHSC